MVARRDKTRFARARVPGSAGDEVIVGAYVDRLRRRNVMIGGAGVVLILCAVWVYSALRPDRPPPPAAGRPVTVHCQACGYEAVVRVASDEDVSPDCPECGARACGALWECRACGERFVPANASGEVRCPECGSLRVGAASAR